MKCGIIPWVFTTAASSPNLPPPPDRKAANWLNKLEPATLHQKSKVRPKEIILFLISSATAVEDTYTCSLMTVSWCTEIGQKAGKTFWGIINTFHSFSLYKVIKELARWLQRTTTPPCIYITEHTVSAVLPLPTSVLGIPTLHRSIKLQRF